VADAVIKVHIFILYTPSLLDKVARSEVLGRVYGTILLYRPSSGHWVTCVIACGDAPFVRTTSWSLGDSISIHKYAESAYLHTKYVRQ
jgi:hypothetical protein